MRVQYPRSASNEHEYERDSPGWPLRERCEHKRQPPEHQRHEHAYRRHRTYPLLFRECPHLAPVGVEQSDGDSKGDASERDEEFGADRELGDHDCDGSGDAHRSHDSDDEWSGDWGDPGADVVGVHGGGRYHMTCDRKYVR